jgi:hypothetical protein
MAFCFPHGSAQRESARQIAQRPSRQQLIQAARHSSRDA